MQPDNFSNPLVRLPPAVDLTLFLIREELKSQKFFNSLDKVGLSDSYYQTHLVKAILQHIGLDDGVDSTYEFYYQLMGKRSKKIEANNDSVMKQAFKVYMELLMEKKRRKQKAMMNN